jgi:outer membrane protein assembly factor BamB
VRTRHVPRSVTAAALTLATLTASVVAAGNTATAATVSVPTTDTAYQISVAHDGFSGDTTIVSPLSARWSHAFAGPVSYPLIVGGMVYVTVADNGGSNGTNLYALDQATGSVVWSQPISGTYFWSNAAYDNGEIFVLNYDGLLREFNAATGAPGWSVQLPGQDAFSSPPTADGGVVYTGGAGSGGTVYAVSEADGSVLWTQAVANGDNSSPALSSTSVFVSYTCQNVYAFDRTTGTSLWSDSGPCEGGGGKTPVYYNGQVYIRDFNGNQILDAGTGQVVGTFSAGPAPAFAGKTGLFLSGGTLQAAIGKRTLWTFTGDGGLDTAPIVVGTTVYVGSSSGMVYGLSLSKGKVVWSANAGSGIPGPDEQNVSQPLTGLGAGQGLLVVPAGDQLVAYGG